MATERTEKIVNSQWQGPYGSPRVGLCAAGVSPARSEGNMPSPSRDRQFQTSIFRQFASPFFGFVRLVPGFVEGDEVVQ